MVSSRSQITPYVDLCEICISMDGKAPRIIESLEVIGDLLSFYYIIKDVKNICNCTILDKGANHYINRGHQGNHCHQGIPASVTTNYTPSHSNQATCVMYGSTASKTGSFCPDCATKVKKIDISNGI